MTASHWNSVFLCLVQSFIINSIIFLIQIVSGSNLGYYWDSELLRIPLEIAHLGERICRLCEFYVHPLKVPLITGDLEVLWNPLQWNLNMVPVFYYLFIYFWNIFSFFGHHRISNQHLKSGCWRTDNVTRQRTILLQNTECDRKINLSYRSYIPGLTGRVLRRPVAPLSKRI